LRFAAGLEAFAVFGFAFAAFAGAFANAFFFGADFTFAATFGFGFFADFFDTPFATRFAAITAAVVLAAVIGLTRVSLRASFFSDVEGGWGVAAAIFALLGVVAVAVGWLRQNDRPQS